MKNTIQLLVLIMGTFVIFTMINPINIFGQERYQHPDASYQKILFETISINSTSVYIDMNPKTYFVVFWLFGVALKIILVATGLIVFCLVFILKGFYRLMRHGVI